MSSLKPNPEEEKGARGLFNLTTLARNKVIDKRKRKGLGNIEPRRKPASQQIVCYVGSLVFTKTLLAPFERIKILMQVSHMANVSAHERPAGAFQVTRKIVSEQGLTAFFRGNMPNVYRHLLQSCVRVGFYDRFKIFYMPQLESNYGGIDLLWRRLAAAYSCGALSCIITYPLDLIHTQMVADYSRRTQPRMYKTTFDCFNRSTIDAGARGPYKGAVFTLGAVVPYTIVRRTRNRRRLCCRSLII